MKTVAWESRYKFLLDLLYDYIVQVLAGDERDADHLRVAFSWLQDDIAVASGGRFDSGAAVEHCMLDACRTQTVAEILDQFHRQLHLVQ